MWAMIEKLRILLRSVAMVKTKDGPSVRHSGSAVSRFYRRC
jgi:hypothetical protein